MSRNLGSSMHLCTSLICNRVILMQTSEVLCIIWTVKRLTTCQFQLQDRAIKADKLKNCALKAVLLTDNFSFPN